MKTEWGEALMVSRSLGAVSAARRSRKKMDADTCLTFSAQSSRRTPEHSPRLEHGSFLPFDESQKASHLPPPLPHRLGLRGDVYAAAMARFGDAPAEFTHGAGPLNPPASPPKHKFLVNPDQKGATISSKPGFYDDNTEGKRKVGAVVL